MNNWGIFKFYSQAWALLIANKKLLLFGLALSVIGGSGASFNGSGDLSRLSEFGNKSEQVENDQADRPSSEKDIIWQEQETDEDILKNLDSTFANGWNDLKEGLKNLPTWLYGLLIIETLSLFAIVIIYALFATGWVEASLIKAIDVANQASDTDWSITEVSRVVWPRIKSVIYIQVLPVLLFMLLSLVPVILLIVLANLIESSPIVLVLIITSTLVWLYLLLRLIACLFLAVRLAVLEGIAAKPALKRAWLLAAGNIFKLLRLFIFGGVISFAAQIFVIIPGIILLGLSFLFGYLQKQAWLDLFSSGVWSWSLIPTISILLLVVILLICASSFISVFMITLQYGAGHYAYLSLIKKGEDEKR